VRRVVLKRLRRAATAVPFCPKRDRVKRRKPYSYFQPRRRRSDAIDDLAQKPGSVLKAAAVVSTSRVCAKEFMSQVAVAMFDVYEIKPDLMRHPGRHMECFYDSANLPVSQNRVVGCDPEPRIQQRMMVKNLRLQAGGIWTTEAARVRQLQPHHQAV